MTIMDALRPQNAADRISLRRLRVWLLVFTMSATACVTSDREEVRAHQDLEILLNRGVAADRPVLLFTVTNKSKEPMCIRSDVLQNPETHEMDVKLRDTHGRVFNQATKGYIPEPRVTGIISIEPDGSAQGSYYLDWKSEEAVAEGLSRDGWSAQLAFDYGSCSNFTKDGPRRATSSWQPI